MKTTHRSSMTFWLMTALFATPSAALDNPLCTNVVPEFCSDTSIEVRLKDGQDDWANDLSEVEANEILLGEVWMHVREGGIQGYSFGVFHDETQLALSNVSDANAGPVLQDADYRLTVPAVQDGLVQAVVLSFTSFEEMPVERDQLVVEMQYTTLASWAGMSWILFAHDILRTHAQSPPVDLVWAKYGNSRSPRKVVDSSLE